MHTQHHATTIAGPTSGRPSAALPRLRPPTVPHPTDLCMAPRVHAVEGPTNDGPACPWARYAQAFRRGDVHPPSIQTRTQADVRRQQMAARDAADFGGW